MDIVGGLLLMLALPFLLAIPILINIPVAGQCCSGRNASDWEARNSGAISFEPWWWMPKTLGREIVDGVISFFFVWRTSAFLERGFQPLANHPSYCAFLFAILFVPQGRWRPRPPAGSFKHIFKARYIVT